MATKLTKKTTQPVKPVKKTSPATSKIKTPSKFTSTVGRRRSAIARIRLFSGKGEIIINGVPASQYWDKPNLAPLYLKPFELTNNLKKYTVTAKIKGGGSMGQIGAFVHGVARALNKIDSEKFHGILKQNGLLTRDPRMKETRKVGRRGKARFKPQSPKR